VSSVRTLPRFVELIYAGLAMMFPVGGLAIIGVAVASGTWVLILLGGLFAAFGLAWNFFVPILRTASRFSLDPGRQTLCWRATMARGEVQLRSIGSIVRANRPSVYELHITDGHVIPFWLGTRSPAVRDLFDEVRASNPEIAMSDLYEKRCLWWSGLPRA
jgi:hypothetical protein